ncbi:orotate phosphoribosyltransferase [Candidatus Aerophobetes bacterium]|uniref:Orotate phosphoribosyltransferase n=1 Tax=Aerophobetes bacterium TaxID=2030807 RepID=A0A2A4YEZ0_UNCAE|nr:MAG: orotate phosphoribosyltransferase [Candidatus Aerophobetes bacterium]
MEEKKSNKYFEIIDRLYEIGALKFGDFKLKSGIQSPFYLDLRLIISHPKLLETISDQLWKKAAGLKIDRICGVPYTALPLATCLSLKHDIPMLLKRKEVKTYGTKKMIEGHFLKNDRCLIIEDLITSGASIIETIKPLQEAGLKIEDIVIIVDREQGGTLSVEKLGFHVHSLYTITDIVNHLCTTGKITEEKKNGILEFIKNNQVSLIMQDTPTAHTR